MGRYPHLVLHRRRWMVRLIVPADVRPILGQSVFKISTGETDEHRAVGKAGPIIAGLKERIRTARATLRKPVETQAEELAAAYQARNAADPSSAQAFMLTDVIGFVTPNSAKSCRPTAATARRSSPHMPRPALMSMRWPLNLQDEGAKAFVKSWHELMDVIGSKSATLAKVS